MSRKGILVIVALFGIAFLLLAAATRGYREVEAMQSMEKAKAAVRRDFPGANPLATAELATWLEEPEGVILLDVREEEEFLASRIPGALSKAKGDLPGGSPTGSAIAEKRLVVYDSVGFRSAEWIESTDSPRPEKVFYLEGGIFQWANEGRSLVDEEGNPTRQVHPYNKLWGRLLERSVK